MSDQVNSRLKLMLAQGTMNLYGAKTMQVTVLDDEPLPAVKRVEPYGFSYRPLPGAQVYLGFPSGDRSSGIALVVGDKRYQMTLESGEVAIHDHEGNHVHIKSGGVIEVKATTKVIADTPMFETTGDAKIGGNLLVAGQTASAGGYYGAEGKSAEMLGGAKVTGLFEVNGVDVSEKHKHTTTQPGAPTSVVNK